MQTHLNAGSFQHLTPLPKNMRDVLDLNQLDHSSIMDSMDSMKLEDPKFTASLIVAINCSMLKFGTPIKRIAKHFLAMKYIDGSTLEGNVLVCNSYYKFSKFYCYWGNNNAEYHSFHYYNE